MKWRPVSALIHLSGGVILLALSFSSLADFSPAGSWPELRHALFGDRAISEDVKDTIERRMLEENGLLWHPVKRSVITDP